MAEDVLAFVLYDYERENRQIPKASDRETVELKEGEFVNYVLCDTMEYRKKHNNKAVKKTLTIPEWLNEAAVSMGLNFSQILQQALLDKIHSKREI